MMADPTRPVTLGIDTHKDFHVAALLDPIGRQVAVGTFVADTTGYEAMLDWAHKHGTLTGAGIEGTGSWGAGISRFLTNAGIDVVEVIRPNRQERRMSGKTDHYDAIQAAMNAMNGDSLGIPKAGDGPVETLRVLTGVRRTTVQTRTATINRLRAVLDTGPDTIRTIHRTQTTHELIATLTRKRPGSDPFDRHQATYRVLKLLATNYRNLDTQTVELTNDIELIINTIARPLIDIHGVGPVTAAALLVATGDNPDRIPNPAAFAKLCGAAPLPASSGKTVRHRLNRGGDRQANNALWRIVMVRLATKHPPTITYMERRTAEGLSKPEIVRCLKTYVARQLFPIIRNTLTN